MRKKIKLFKLFYLSACCVSLLPIKAIAQHGFLKNTPASDSLIRNKDLNVDSTVNLPLGVVVSKNNSTVSSQKVYNRDLVKSPVVDVVGALPGRIAGLYTRQSSGQPGLDGLSVTLRGRTPLVLIDGIPRLLSTLSMEEVESVTVLKDAMATALLGVRGTNGAILINTKQGFKGKELISFTVQSASQRPLEMPKALNAFDYATLRNEAISNELSVQRPTSTDLKYSDAALQAYQNGTDPVGYPDVDYRSAILKSSAPFTRYSLNMSGGNNMVTYYAGLEHLKQEGLFKTDDDLNPYNTNNFLKSYILRSNINVQINPKLSGGIHLFGRIGNSNEPGAGTSNIYNALLTTPSTSYPLLNPDGSLGGTSRFTQNIYGQAVMSGYLQSFKRDIIADLHLKRSLDDITPGLYVKGAASYATYLVELTDRSKPIVAYQRTVINGVDTYSPLANPAQQVNTSTISRTSDPESGGQGRQAYFELSAGYHRTFENTHSFDAVVLANSDNNVYGGNVPYNIKGLSGRAAYAYNDKYIAEIAAAYSGSNRYPGKSHYKMGFFPVFGLGWVISKEGFLKNNRTLNYLKLSANYGKTGNDNPGYFSYIQRFPAGNTVYFGTNPATVLTLREDAPANEVTFEAANKLNVNLQGILLNSRLGFSVDYYNNTYEDLLRERGRSTSLLGNDYPNENIGRQRTDGFDFQLSWQQPKKDDFSYFISANIGLQQSELLYFDEVDQPYSWMRRTGQKSGQSFGYVADGLFRSQVEVDMLKDNGYATLLGYTPQPGDIRYKDLNNDGVLNQFDQTVIGPKGPLTTLGASLGFSYKFLDFSALFQGVANYTVNLNGNSYFEFQNNGVGNAYSHHLNRFTPETAATATYPRLSIGFNQNNHASSSYWLRRADYIRLRNAEIGITVPARYTNAIKLNSIRFFANGINLFTVSRLKGDRDPEVANGAYPIQQVYNLGVNVKF